MSWCPRPHNNDGVWRFVKNRMLIELSVKQPLRSFEHAHTHKHTHTCMDLLRLLASCVLCLFLSPNTSEVYL